MNTLLQSSSNPNKVAMTIKGILVLLIPTAIIVGQKYGIPLTEAGLMEFIENATIFIGAAMTAFGLARKFYYWCKPWFFKA